MEKVDPARVVLDTNVFVAAGFKPRSASARILNAVKQGRLRMVWNDATRRVEGYSHASDDPSRSLP